MKKKILPLIWLKNTKFWPEIVWKIISYIGGVQACFIRKDSQSPGCVSDIAEVWFLYICEILWENSPYCYNHSPDISRSLEDCCLLINVLPGGCDIHSGILWEICRLLSTLWSSDFSVWEKSWRLEKSAKIFNREALIRSWSARPTMAFPEARNIFICKESWSSSNCSEKLQR